MTLSFRHLPGVAIAMALLAAPTSVGSQALAPAIVVLVVDTSGSVGRVQLERAVSIAERLLENLPVASEVAVFTFDDDARLVAPRTSSVGEVRARLAGLRISGRHTALHDALYDASRYAQEAPAARRALILITDGRDEDSALNLDDGLRLAQEARIPVHVIAVGAPDERVLRRVAKLTGGTYARLADVRAAALASALTAQPAAPSPVTSATLASAPAPAREGAAVPHAGRAPPGVKTPLVAPAAARPTGPRSVSWLLGGLLVAAAAVAMLVLTRRRRGAACPSCGEDVPFPGARCAACSRETPRSTPARPPAASVAPSAALTSVPASIDHDLSPTVLARMNVTEEFLERTVTLHSRPILSITRGPDVGRVVELSDSVATSLGRAKANDLSVNDIAVSSQHCRIRPEEGRFVLHDLKSTNGTFVNERRIASQALLEGDVIKIGETHLQFRMEMKRS